MPSRPGGPGGPDREPLVRPRRIAAISAAALASAMLTWGHPGDLAFVGLAWLLQATAVGEALRHRAVPPFPRTAGVLAGLAALVPIYAAALGLAWARAWPARTDGPPGATFLIDRWAYRRAWPDVGHLVWVGRESATPAWGAVRIAARPGEVWPAGALPPSLVPAGFHLVRPEITPRHDTTEAAGQLHLVPTRTIHGRVWAVAWPMWDRGRHRVGLHR